jgi:glycosyltransferase involved in cell wall biosynthesis
VHVLEEVPSDYEFRLWIVDDGCTDNTIDLLSAICNPYAIIRLDGNAYWGGALNAIRSIVSKRLQVAEDRNGNNSQQIVMVCNDDIRFQPHALKAGLLALDPAKVVCARCSAADFDPTLPSACPTSSQVANLMFFFDKEQGRFALTTNLSQVNVAPTYAIMSYAQAWSECRAIPCTIPHYLSDYWLTYEMHSNGFRLLFPDGFSCCSALGTTRNKRVPWPKAASVNLPAWTSWLHAIQACRPLAASLISYADPLSVAYAPAWITFLLAHSPKAAVSSASLRMLLFYVIGLALRGMLYPARFLSLDRAA